MGGNVTGEKVIKKIEEDLKSRKGLDADVLQRVLGELLMNPNPMEAVTRLELSLHTLAMRRAKQSS
jgi:hypothetical protein